MPEEPPPAITRRMSIPRCRAFIRSQRMALLSSSRQRSGGVRWMLSIRYSGVAAIMPRSAKYSAVAANCMGLPVAQLPQKRRRQRADDH